MNARRTLKNVQAPDEPGAQQRAWVVVRSVYRESAPTPARVGSRLVVALVPVVAAVAAAVALSPAGATVARLVKDALGVTHAAKALVSLPAPGRVLVSGPGGAWVIHADGSARRLGSWPEASWSPDGLYVAVARGDRLAAVDPHGTVRWSVARSAVADPRWYPPSGYRVAYLSGNTVRVIVGDGSGDHLLASDAARVAPAWRPGRPDGPYQLAYLSSAGEVIVRDADTGRVIWKAAPPAPVRTLAWSNDGSRLLALSWTRATLFDPSGRVLQSTPTAGSIIAGALSPSGRQLALIRTGERTGAQSGSGGVDQLVLSKLGSASAPLKVAFSGSGIRDLAWSPNGRWLLVGWPAADQWVFIRVAPNPRIVAVSRIAQQFGSGLARGRFPTLDGWCCTARPRPG